MPKPFMLGVEIEEIALGKVMRVLNKMPGVVRLHMDLKTHGGKPNGHTPPRKSFEKSGDQVILESLRKKPLPTAALREIFVAQHRSPHSINSCLHGLKTEGLLQHTEGGEWTLTKKAKDQLRRSA